MHKYFFFQAKIALHTKYPHFFLLNPLEFSFNYKNKYICFSIKVDVCFISNIVLHFDLSETEFFSSLRHKNTRV